MPSAKSTAAYEIDLNILSKPDGNYEAVVVWANTKGEFASVDTKVDRTTKRAIATRVFIGKGGQTTALPIDDDGHRFARVILAGLGEPKEAKPTSYRAAAAAVAKLVRSLELRRVLVIPPTSGLAVGELAAIDEAIATGLVLGGFEFVAMKGSMTVRKNGAIQFDMIATSKPAARAGEQIGRGQNFARTIASLPGNVINPPALAQVARQLAATSRQLRCTVLDEKQLAKLGMGGLLAVGGGSKTPPRLIAIEYLPAKKSSAPPLLVVGKAITFDAGGISLKPADGMGDMIYDKSGATAVLGLMHTLAGVGASRRVVGLLASAENVLSENSFRPGDIITHYNGITSQITNTDAEGRLVLADTLAWGIEQYAPEAVIDLATLTGGCVVALGHAMAGAFSNDDGLYTQVYAASSKTGEKLWRLPLDDSFSDKMKGTQSDIINSAGRWGSPCTAAAYLQFFVDRPGKAGKRADTTKPTPWVHLDIAGVSDSEKDLPLTGKGATGFGVRTLFEWVRAR